MDRKIFKIGLVCLLCLLLSGCISWARWYTHPIHKDERVIAISLTGMIAKRGDKEIEVKHPLGFMDNLFNFGKK